MFSTANVENRNSFNCWLSVHYGCKAVKARKFSTFDVFLKKIKPIVIHRVRLSLQSYPHHFNILSFIDFGRLYIVCENGRVNRADLNKIPKFRNQFVFGRLKKHFYRLRSVWLSGGLTG